jgi:hypothetical protein
MVIIKNLGARTDSYPYGPRHWPNPAHLVAEIMSWFRPGSNDTNQTLHKHFQLSQCHSFFAVRKLFVDVFVNCVQNDQELIPSTERCDDIWALKTDQ